MGKIKQNTLVCDAWQILFFSCEGKKFTVSANDINYLTRAETWQRLMMCLDTENVVNHWAQVSGSRHLTTAVPSPPHCQGEGRPQDFNQVKAAMAKSALWALCSGKCDYTEKDAINASEPNRQCVNPAATIYSPHSRLFWKKFPETSEEKNLMSCFKARGMFLFFIG